MLTLLGEALPSSEARHFGVTVQPFVDLEGVGGRCGDGVYTSFEEALSCNASGTDMGENDDRIMRVLPDCEVHTSVEIEAY